jgi:hypothetical protein
MRDRSDPMSVQKITLNHHYLGGHLNPGNITQNIYQAKPEFFEPNLDQFQPSKFPSPTITPDLIQILLQENLLVLGASPDLDKASIARHLAWCLSQELQQSVTCMSQRIPIKEWYRCSDSQSFDIALQETKTTTIFILPDVLPQHIGLELFDLQKIAARHHHYVVMSTNVFFAHWKLSDSERRFWRNLSADGLYRADDLVTVLIDKLKEAKNFISPTSESENLQPHSVIGNLTLQEVAKRLKTPERITCFVVLLSSQNESLQLETVHELIDIAQNDESTLRRWFHHILTSREQLLALGLNFFDDLFDDQCIAGIGRLIENEWYRRDSSLQALDYCDLHNLQHFFRLVEIPAEKTKKFESWLFKQRKMLFEVAWDSYRIRIQTALPVMVELVTHSASQKSLDQRLHGISVGQHLYGSKLRRDQLREVIGEAISDIGLIDSREVQESLLALALHSNTGVQAVAARAMARWCEYGHYKQLFDTLKSLKAYGEKKGEKSQDYIMNTIALTVGYAAQYDAPQGNLGTFGLSKQLCDILKQLAEYSTRIVRHRFGFLTLRMVVPLHLVQLADLLHDMTRHIDLIRWISESVALAYPRNPQEVLKILNLWWQECRDTTADILSHEVPRAALLETVALTYVKILCYQKNDNLRAKEICQKLQLFFLEEKHYFVRDTVIKEICHQIGKNFQYIEPSLKSLIAEFTNEERYEIVKAFSKIYREQRKQLDNGNENLAGYGYDLPTWLTQERPSTLMEEAMFRWLMSSDNPTAQMIAARLVLGEELNFKETQEVLNTLNLWYEESKKYTYSLELEALLTAIALIVISLQCHAGTRTAKVVEAFDYVQTIVSQKELVFARKSIVNAICSLQDECLLQIQPQLLTILSDLTDNESHQIREALSQAEQRQPAFLDNHGDIQQSRLHQSKTERSVTQTQGKIQLSINLLELPQQHEKSSTHQSRKKKSLKKNRKNQASSLTRTRVVILTSILCFVSSYLLVSLIRHSIPKLQLPTYPGLKSIQLPKTL